MARTIVGDITGIVFGRLTVLEVIPGSGATNTICRCVCECGNEKETTAYKLLTKSRRSCGCLHNRAVNTKVIAHGMRNSASYGIWKSIIQRCTNPKNLNYPNYGMRGINICKEWRESFEQFYLDMGDRPDGKSIERIDNTLGYSKENCRWATLKEQGRNKRNNKLITYKGETKTLVEWNELMGFKKTVIRDRLRRGWSLEQIFTTPVEPKNNRKPTK